MNQIFQNGYLISVITILCFISTIIASNYLNNRKLIYYTIIICSFIILKHIYSTSPKYSDFIIKSETFYRKNLGQEIAKLDSCILTIDTNESIKILNLINRKNDLIKKYDSVLYKVVHNESNFNLLVLFIFIIITSSCLCIAFYISSKDTKLKDLEMVISKENNQLIYLVVENLLIGSLKYTWIAIFSTILSLISIFILFIFLINMYYDNSYILDGNVYFLNFLGKNLMFSSINIIVLTALIKYTLNAFDLAEEYAHRRNKLILYYEKFNKYEGDFMIKIVEEISKNPKK